MNKLRTTLDTVKGRFPVTNCIGCFLSIRVIRPVDNNSGTVPKLNMLLYIHVGDPKHPDLQMLTFG